MKSTSGIAAQITLEKESLTKIVGKKVVSVEDTVSGNIAGISIGFEDDSNNQIELFIYDNGDTFITHEVNIAPVNAMQDFRELENYRIQSINSNDIDLNGSIVMADNVGNQVVILLDDSVLDGERIFIQRFNEDSL